MDWSNLPVTLCPTHNHEPKPQLFTDLMLRNSPFLLPLNLTHPENSPTWVRCIKMEKLVSQTNLFGWKSHSEMEKQKWMEDRKFPWNFPLKKGAIFDDNVILEAASAPAKWWLAQCCLDMPSHCYTVSVFGLHALWSALQNQESKHQAKLQACAPCGGRVGSGGKIIPHTKANWGFHCCPSCGQKFEKQECMRAWSWLSSKQISVRRQVCSARPHSSSYS